MFYVGHVTKQQFIKRLRRELLHASSSIQFNVDFCTPDTLVVHTQPDSTFVLVISVKDANLGECLHIQIDYCEILLVKNTNRFEPINPVQWESRLYGIYERKRLRRYCTELANKIYEHISELENILPCEFNDR